MARNKYPEQTVQHILSVAAQLFTDKGYEKTSIQDILEALGMSKGAIYHHFKSKEEILNAVMEQQFEYSARMLDQLVIHTTAATAKEKLIQILEHVLSDPQAHSLDRVLQTQIKNPLFIVRGIQQAVQMDAPVIAAMMKEGVADGSISTADPEATAEVFMMLVNIWINPAIFGRSIAATKQRLIFLQTLMKTLGADIVNDELIEQILKHHEKIGAFVTAKSNGEGTEGAYD
ncbi:TetR/AcrR family transcriptional regulator [Paenibacillus xylanilyticus]|uniref:TetR/AcrR family transcriptional regulator n=1 Tax=Paenibacillus xylanilyticus TaxID=248903 RepID=UPI0039A2B498